MATNLLLIVAIKSLLIWASCFNQIYCML